MKYKVISDYFLVENLEEEEKENKAGILLPVGIKTSDFMRLKVVTVSADESVAKPGDIILAEKMFVPLDRNNKKIGLIKREYIHLIEA